MFDDSGEGELSLFEELPSLLVGFLVYGEGDPCLRHAYLYVFICINMF